MKILVTGGTGFIGEYFIPALLEEGHDVKLLVRDLKKGKNLFGDKCKYFVGDITERESLIGCCDGIDIVYHMVAKVGNELPNKTNFQTFRKVNVEGTKNLIDECKHTHIEKFVYVSSIAAMGIVEETPINENSKCNPYLPYQVSKYEAEMLIKSEYEKNGFPGICLRPTKVYGVGEHEYSYLTLAKLCKKGIYPKVGKKHNYTSNIYISDFVKGLVQLLYYGTIGETYIITSNESISFIDTGILIAQNIEKKITIIPIPAKVMIMAAAFEEALFLALKKRPFITKKNVEATLFNRIYDITKARNELHFNPEVPLKEGITRTVKWYIEKGII